MVSGNTVRWLRTSHATAIAAVVAAGIYIYVPPFAPVFAAWGDDIPMSARLLMASYPFAFVLPLAAFVSGLRLDAKSRWRWFFVPSTYLAAIAVVAFVVWALYAPAFELSTSK
jgi:hypothetical protein